MIDAVAFFALLVVGGLLIIDVLLSGPCTRCSKWVPWYAICARCTGAR